MRLRRVLLVLPVPLCVSLVVAMVALSPVSPSAQAAPRGAFRYLGPHPIPARYGGGFCNIHFPHFHDYMPAESAPYRRHDDAYVFVGDPASIHGYDGPKYAYYGPHPLPPTVLQGDDGTPAYCYIRGPHYHTFAPVVDDDFSVKDGVYWYTGSFGPTFYTERPEYEAPINAYYRPLQYDRPVAVEPPAGYQVVVAPPPAGVVVDASVPGVWVAPPVVGVAVTAPTITVTPFSMVSTAPEYDPPPVVVTNTPPVGVVVTNTPAIGMVVNAPAAGVVVTPPAAGVVVSPGGVTAVVQPPSIGIQVGLPSVGMVVGAPGVIVGGPGPRPEYEAPEHHDDGRHEGWFRGGGGEDHPHPGPGWGGDRGDHGWHGEGHGHGR